MNHRTLWNTETGQEWTEAEPIYAVAPIARHSDPITSQQSAAETESKLGTIKAAVLDILQMTPVAMTAQETALAAVKVHGGLTETYRKRCHELVNDCLAIECGFRRCEITGKNAQTFKARDRK